MRIQLRRGTAAAWAADNPVLAQGEPGYETDTGGLKVGDGATAYTSLAYTVVPGQGGPVFPLAGTGLLAASLAPESALAVSALTNNQPFMARIWVPAQTVITKLWAAVRDVGVWDGATNGSTIGLYTDAGVFVDQIGVANNLWTANGWVGGALTGGPVAAQSVGRFVYGALLGRGMNTPATVAQQNSANDGGANPTWYNSGPAGSGATHRRAFFVGGTVLPASFNPVSAGTATTFTPMIAIT